MPAANNPPAARVPAWITLQSKRVFLLAVLAFAVGAGACAGPATRTGDAAPSNPTPRHDSASRARSVLVFGGSGQLGAQIVRALLHDGYAVHVFIRPSSSRGRIAGLDAQLIEGDVLNESDVRRALQSRHFDVVVNALGRSEQPVSFYATSGQLIAKWSKATAVNQAILHSSVGVGDSRDARAGVTPPSMVALFHEKSVAESALIDSGIVYTIIRNDTLRDIAVDALDRAELFSDQHKLGLVSRRGLARLTSECIGAKRCHNAIFHAVDPSMRP